MRKLKENIQLKYNLNLTINAQSLTQPLNLSLDFHTIHVDIFIYKMIPCHEILLYFTLEDSSSNVIRSFLLVSYRTPTFSREA